MHFVALQLKSKKDDKSSVTREQSGLYNNYINMCYRQASMQTSQLKRIHSWHFKRNIKSAKELCTVTPVNTYSMLYRCLRLPKTKRENMHRSSISSPDQNNIMLQHYYNPNCKCLTSFFLLFTATAFIFYFCVVMPQRSDVVICELYRACFYNCTLRILILFY